MADGGRYPRPTLRDWALLGVSLIFVAGGLLIMGRDPKIGIITLAFFGSGGVVHGATILQKLRFRRFHVLGVEVTGGVPIRPPRARFLLLGGWLVILGLIMLFLSDQYPLLFRILSGVTAAMGAVLVGGVLAGRFPRQFLQFDPDALTLGQGRWAARIPWDAIAVLHEAYWQSNPVLLIGIYALDAVEVDPPAERPKLPVVLARNQAMYGFSCFAVMPGTYGIDLPVLTASVARYVTDASARRELARRSIPAAAS